MTYSLTIFRSIFDNQTVKRMDFKTWNGFEELLYSLSKQPGYKAKRGEKGKQSSPLISPAIYKPDSTRANVNVEAWAGWAALDVDNYSGKFDDLQERLGPYYSICYSTASCTAEKLKFRIVLPLNTHVPADKIRHFWYALNKEFGQAGDEQTKDLSRMYYVPAQYPNAQNFIFTHRGEVIKPYDLMEKHAYVAKSTGSFLDQFPEAFQKELLEMRKAQMTNTSVHWSSYLDCPFVNKRLLNEYRSIALIDGSGRYRMTYKIMTSIACNAVKRKYPISAGEISELVSQLDRDTANIYQHRPLKVEAERAIAYAYRHAASQ